VVVFDDLIDQYLAKARQEVLTMNKFVYDKTKYNEDQKKILELQHKSEGIKSQLSQRLYFGFSELFAALMHLKVMRAFIDGVLRFGIPPRFFIGVVRPNKGYEKLVLQRLSDAFADKAMAEMYGTKEDTNDTEDFFPFVNISLTAPLFLQ